MTTIQTPPTTVLAKDHLWFKPDEFTMVKVNDTYVISLSEHILQPLTRAVDGTDQFELSVERRVRATIQIPLSFFASLVNVAKDIEERSAASASTIGANGDK